MYDLQSTAHDLAEASMNSRLEALPRDVKPLQQDLAAKGSLKSGNMLRGVLRISQDAITAQAATLTEHYTWAVQESLVATHSWVKRLAHEAADSLGELFRVGSEQIVAACNLAQQPQLADRLTGDLQSTLLKSRRSIELALEAAFAGKSRGMLKKLTSVLSRLVSGLGGK